MPKLIIQHLNQCNAEITDGFILYDVIAKKDNIVDFYLDGKLIATLRGRYFPQEILLEDTIDEKTEKELIDR